MRLLACPNCCANVRYEAGKKRPRTFGRYKIYVTDTNMLIFNCGKCHLVFKMRAFGAILDKEDRLMGSL